MIVLAFVFSLSFISTARAPEKAAFATPQRASSKATLALTNGGRLEFSEILRKYTLKMSHPVGLPTCYG